MPSAAPLVTVVTPTWNAGRFLEESIQSVLDQDYPNIEYLVVDSHSTDNTRDILRKYAGRLRTIQAKRLGPASAINTGLSQARGSILAWLNADDTYEPQAVRSAVAAFMEHPDADVVYGDARWIDQNGAVIGTYPTIPFESSMLERDCFISQPASFFLASAYRECTLDPSLPLSFDYDLWIRLTKNGRLFKYVPERFASSRMHRECLTLSRRREVFDVTMALLKKHYGYIPLSWIFGYLSYRRDGRDQFFEPLQYSAAVFAASLPFGIAVNRTEPLRLVREWAQTVRHGVRQRFSRLPVLRGPEPAESAAPEVQPTAASRRA
jgi:glycosyltransferase involved in cell wall biosynthesis